MRAQTARRPRHPSPRERLSEPVSRTSRASLRGAPSRLDHTILAAADWLRAGRTPPTQAAPTGAHHTRPGPRFVGASPWVHVPRITTWGGRTFDICPSKTGVFERLPIVHAERLSERVDARRLAVSSELESKRRAHWGQFFTPGPVADFLARQLDLPATGVFRLLDPGAGVGSLTAAVVAHAIRSGVGCSIQAVGFEADPRLFGPLAETFSDCERAARRAGIKMQAELRGEDFLVWSAEHLVGFSAADPERFDACVMNPPYRKINTRSLERAALERLGLRVTNLYTAFLGASCALLRDDGQLSAITPRSFANGPYFLPFREFFLARMGIDRLHVYDRRGKVFADAAVLQENVVLKARRGSSPTTVTISVSAGHDDEPRVRSVPASQVVEPMDPQKFIRIPVEAAATEISARVSALPSSLEELGVQVSTGRVVDFRSADHLVHDPDSACAPLVYPSHLRHGRVTWPLLDGKKPNSLQVNAETQGLLLPAGHYVLVKRFSAKEERRRVTASYFAPSDVDSPTVGFENHLNVFHQTSAGLEPALARGLAWFLNSTLVDAYVRLFSGHTQVNATDLRLLRYPDRQTLTAMGGAAESEGVPAPQGVVDGLVEGFLVPSANPVPGGRVAA